MARIPVALDDQCSKCSKCNKCMLAIETLDISSHIEHRCHSRIQKDVPQGNGQRDNGEACDDGNLIAADGCSPGCEAPETWERETDVAMGLEDR